MAKYLVIVESPAKAKTIGRYLGKDYKIAASVGHIRDLPAATLAVDIRNGYKPIYINMRGKEKVIKELKQLSKESDFVYIATDPDREGEAIAWHIAKTLNIDLESNCRITFNEITKNAVKKAIESPRKIDINLFNAQQARRVLDRLVGYELSPLLWQKIRKGLSAGRVQSVATKIVMDRDAEIDEFVPEEYWLVNANLSPKDKKHEFKARFYGVNNNGKISKVKLSDKASADAVINAVANNDFVASSVKKGKRQRNPYPPFTTSTLQQEASKRLGFSSRKTMSVAQQLYEGVEISGHGQNALVSYIRTDSVRISEEAVSFAREYIESKYGKEYLPKTKRSFTNKNSSQDAHEAIRPTHFEFPPESIKASLQSDQYKLYKLIWERFIASQMASVALDTVALELTANGQVFRTQGETVTFPGFLALYDDVNEDVQENTDDENAKVKLPEINEGDILKNLGVAGEQKHTLPPPYFTEATLIKTLEENGIGRPSTYAPTISTILERDYVKKEGRLIKITELGKLVTDMLAGNFKEIVDVSFTADMEKQLDDVESGKKDWVAVMDSFYPNFHEQIVEAGKSIEKVKFEEEHTGETCPKCGKGELLIKSGRFGKFIACSDFPQCDYTDNIKIKANGSHCPLCGSDLYIKQAKKRKNKTFYVCSKEGSDKDCEFISWDLPVDDKKCEVCGSYMVWKTFRGKKFMKCSNKDCTTNAKKAKA